VTQIDQLRLAELLQTDFCQRLIKRKRLVSALRHTKLQRIGINKLTVAASSKPASAESVIDDDPALEIGPYPSSHSSVRVPADWMQRARGTRR
jgi:hypothetical protein